MVKLGATCSRPKVLWATNQSTGKKAPYWAFYDELKADFFHHFEIQELASL